MESTAHHALYLKTKGGIKTKCVEFAEFGDNDVLTVTTYELRGSGGHFSLLPVGKPQFLNRVDARARYAELKTAGYQR